MSKASSNIIVKAGDDDTLDWLTTESGFLEACGSIAGDPLVLEPFQLTFLDYRRRDTGLRPKYRVINKSRRIGFSFICGSEATARCLLPRLGLDGLPVLTEDGSPVRRGYKANFISYNLADAKEIIENARMIHEELPLSYQKRLVVDTKTELQFERPGGRRAERSRIVSMPAKPPRGKDGDVYMDEFAHTPSDVEIYNGATALISRHPAGQLTIGSSPLGQRGKFWEIFTRQGGKYGNYTQFQFPWWSTQIFCSDISTASRLAPTMTTHERLDRFGNDGIRAQFEAMDLESFQQEFECDFTDERESFISYDEILRQMLDEPNDEDDDGPKNTLINYAGRLHEFPKPKGRLVAAVDIGRVNDDFVVKIFEEHEGVFYSRYYLAEHGRTFAWMDDHVRMVLHKLPIDRIYIDGGGLGRQMAEQLEADFPDVVTVEHFSMGGKAAWAINLKKLFEERRIWLPREKRLATQIHAVKRTISPKGNVVFQAKRSKAAGHGDAFWAVAMAVQDDGVGKHARRGGVVQARVIGGGGAKPGAGSMPAWLAAALGRG
ncbi:MAG: hypothetical protein KKH12_16165 [Gammaproteobacteria bacterium]|nr:hypothetical protein [Gammaproteobacteria bacterium]